MNIIIAGDGEVGMHLAEALVRSNHNITIVDPHEELLKMMESHSDLMTITGDSTSTAVLQRANVKIGCQTSHRARQHDGEPQSRGVAHVPRPRH